jgi:hypothetical protein
MSHYYSPKQEFKHTYDCEPSGCPGHKMYIDYASTYDAVHIFIDNKLYYTFNDAVWNCIINLSQMLVQGKP